MKKAIRVIKEYAIITAIVMVVGWFFIKIALPGQEKWECQQWFSQLKQAPSAVLKNVKPWQIEQCQAHGIELPVPHYVSR